MTVGLMHEARRIVQATEDGELAAGMDGHAFDAVGDLGYDLGYRGAVESEIGDKEWIERPFAANVPTVGDEDPATVVRETAGERAFPIRQSWLDRNFTLVGD